MPIFEYLCPFCSHIYEELAKPSDHGPKPCPQCGSDKATKVPSVSNCPGAKRTFRSTNGLKPSGSSAPSGCAPGGGFS